MSASGCPQIKDFVKVFQRSASREVSILLFDREGLLSVARKRALLSRPIKRRAKTNLNLVTRVFARFKQVTCFYLEFALVDDDFNLFPDCQS